MLPLRPDGFLADLRVHGGTVPLTLDDVDAAVDAISDERDAAGVAAFRTECRQALAALCWQRAAQYGQALRPRGRLSGGPWLGLAGMVCYDALAATMPHPAYPTWACRLGWSEADSLRYAPEFTPEFELAWVAIPRTALLAAEGATARAAGEAGAAGAERPAWWPGPADVGLPGSLAADHELLPVHPLTAATVLEVALGEADLAATAVVAPVTWLRVRPTLSTRTVAVACAPAAHVKLPLPASTLGLLNRRAIAPGTLADGALIGRTLAIAAAGDPALDGLLLADDGSYAHAGHPYLGYLLRLLPGDLDRCRVVAVAALLAGSGLAGSGLAGSGLAGSGLAGGQLAGGRRLVIEELADGDLLAWFAGYLELLFGIAVRLFVRYGIALESHQQNAAVVVSATADLRLLVKDFDGALISHARLAAALGPQAPDRAEFADQRLLTDSDDALADVFITITVHLCAGALAFGLAERGRAPLTVLLALIRQTLAGVLDRYPGHPAAALLRTRVLNADRLPGKAMVTAGTLVSKARTGASDINKFYGTTGPNYLKVPA
jgi:hypothetical protein